MRANNTSHGVVAQNLLQNLNLHEKKNKSVFFYLFSTNRLIKLAKNDTMFNIM